MASTFVLRCFHTPSFRLIVPCTVAILGRGKHADLVIDDPSVSRKHAEIRISGGKLLVADLGSRNGTFVRNVRIQSTEAAHGQVLRFGTVPFEIEISEESEPASDDDTDDAGNEQRARLHAMHPAVKNLSDAQRKVFDVLITGHPEKNIARRLKLSPHTVHNHVKAILRAFAVHSRLELLAVLRV